ncbi:MAG: NADH-quinone oxidoreductase subunit J [Chloroflexota bacterium]
MGGPILFLILATISVFAAISMLVSRNAVHSALFLILNFAAIAVFFLILNAPFLAAVQITVYAGAIMVLFLFVIMLLGAEESSGILGTRRGQLTTAFIMGALVLGSFIAAVLQTGQGSVPAAPADSAPRRLAIILFEDFVFPFEVTGILLLVAVVGLYVMSRRISAKERREEA